MSAWLARQATAPALSRPNDIGPQGRRAASQKNRCQRQLHRIAIIHVYYNNYWATQVRPFFLPFMSRFSVSFPPQGSERMIQPEPPHQPVDR